MLMPLRLLRARPAPQPPIAAQLAHSRPARSAATSAPRTPALPAFAQSALQPSLDPPTVRTDPAAVSFLTQHRAVAATVDRDTVFVRPEHAGSHAVLRHEYAHVEQLRSGRPATRDDAEAAAQHAAAGGARNVGGAAAPPLFQPIGLPAEVFTGASAATDANAATGLHDNEGNPLALGRGGRRYLTAAPATWSWSAPGYKPELLPANPLSTFNGLMQQVEAIHAQQRATAERLKAAHDMKYWFARVYEYVTENEIAAIRARRYMYPHMKMQEVIGFQQTYMANLNAWEHGAKQQVESNWQAAFAAAESSSMTGSVFGWDIKNALLPSMQAHIRFDLPRAIASAYATNYSGIPNTTIGDFHADFEAMGPVFDAAQAEIEPELVSWHDRNAWFLGRVGNWHLIPGGGSGPRFWGSIFDAIFDVTKERDETWVKATMVAAMEGLPNVTQPQAQAVLEVGQPAHAFNIGGIASSDAGASTSVADYDWLHQPTAAGFTSPAQSADVKATQIEAIVRQWWVSDGDIAQIEHILATVQTQADMDVIRARIEPGLGWHLTSPPQWVRVFNALHRRF